MASESRPSGRARAGPEDSLRTFKLLEALRAYGDASKPGGDSTDLVALINAFPRNNAASTMSADGTVETPPGPSTPLHLAVQCARTPAVTLTLQTRPWDINARNSRGQTPLHLACATGRSDVVAAFLAAPEVDDMVRDSAGRTCLQVSKGVEIVNMLQVSRAQQNATYAELLTAYVATSAEGPLETAEREKLVSWINRPRSRCLDFGVRAPGRGTTVLHEAARRRDLELLKLCHAKGADVLARDNKGKLPSEVAKDDKVKAWLRATITAEGRALKASTSSVSGASQRSSVQGANSSAPPYRSGYLSKWVNVAKGYGQRWFVLQNGTLTYFRHQEDEGHQSRGTVSLAHATITGPHKDKLKFEVTSDIAKRGKWYLKANHPLEAIRWVEDLKLHIEFARAGSAASRNVSVGGSNAPSRTTSVSHLSPMMATDELPRISAHASQVSQVSGISGLPDTIEPRGPPTADGLDDDGEGSVYTFGDDGTTGVQPPHEDSYHIVANSARAQLDATEQLLDAFGVSPAGTGPPSIVEGVTGQRARPASFVGTADSQHEVKRALQQSLRRLGELIDEHLEQAGERERWYARRYEREMDAKRLWEETTRQVAQEQAELETELSRVTRDSVRRKKELRTMRQSIMYDSMDAAADDTANAAFATGPPPGRSFGTPSPQRSPATSPPLTPVGIGRNRAFSTATARAPSMLATVSGTNRLADGGSSEGESDGEEEFFEAIDANTLPLTVDQSIANPSVQPTPESIRDLHDSEEYAMYKDLRKELPIKADNRPPVSLWAILKGSIGKDLTKISFPVYFNEPTSMLQRMAEDMEFSECLDAAAQDRDSAKRIAYVAAFAMSNYSSTQGRIAKPFNALLSETFEYVRLDKHYRYISEQVSHHPPISACIGESPSWRYFGEVDAKSKFTGRSFEIRPTGNAHAMLSLPKAWAPNYPEDKRPEAKDKVIEHYSWRKVTTSVSNFVMGTPQIDHYGDMEITNHRTGEKCVLTFKPRGWRGKDAFEIAGYVANAANQVQLEIAGRWNSQLIARRPGTGGQATLQPDAQVASPSSASSEAEYFLLWRNSPKTPGLPFNLTDYAITLNGVDTDLRKWLPPTDCRLRPDQHFFESGKFEKANELKSGLEEYQRATRKKRELGEMPPHQPRWFTRKTEPDTKEGYWEPAETGGRLDYWTERSKAGQSGQWKNVEAIFGQYAELVSVD